MPFKPQDYITFSPCTKEEANARVDYDMDEEDIVWLANTNRERVENGLDEISCDAFEILMDRFEKESYFQAKTLDNKNNTLKIQEHEAVCCICSNGACWTNNEILFCDMCNIAVHQECYGVPYIPDGQWLCRRCSCAPNASVKCVLCPNEAGALKMTNDGKWAHILCAMWIPEVNFSNPVFLEPIESVDQIPLSRWKLTCKVCKKKGIGVCINCMRRKCSTSFHPTCAQQAGFFMKFSGRPGDQTTRSNRSAFCIDHIPKSQISKAENLDEKINKLKKKMLESVKTPVTFVPTVPPERVQDIGKLVDFEKKTIFVTKILAYWSIKRSSHEGVPITQPRNEFYTDEKQLPDTPKPKCDIFDAGPGEMTSVYCTRHHLEKARLLLELIKKRERLKLAAIKVKEKITFNILSPIVPFLKKLIEELRSLDEDEIFDRPVDVTKVPTYTKIIKKPMDFSTMSYKIDGFCYDTLDEFESDFNLMINNCLHFNEKNTFYHKAALQLRRKSRPVLKEAKRLVEYMTVVDGTTCSTSTVVVKTEPTEFDEVTSNTFPSTTKEGLNSENENDIRENNNNENTDRTFYDHSDMSKVPIINIKREPDDSDSVSCKERISYSL